MQRPTEENLYEDGYDAIGAQADYEQKRKVCRRRRKRDDPELYALVKEKLLDQQWSPEQIQYRLRHENSGVMDKTGAFFETWDSNGQNGCF